MYVTQRVAFLQDQKIPINCKPRYTEFIRQILHGMLLGISNYFLMFRDVYALYGSNPPARLYMLQHFMNGNFYQLNHQLLSAAALATVLLITGTVWFGKRCTVEKTENGKGRRQ